MELIQFITSRPPRWLVDGKLVAAVEEERFNRIKHGKTAEFDNPHQLPERAIRYCLNHAGLTAAISITWPIHSVPRCAKRITARSGGIRGSRKRSGCGLVRCKLLSRNFLGRPLKQGFHFVPHHMAHAASAYFPSGFDSAAILSLDGIGEFAGSFWRKARGTRIEPVESIDYPNSLGFLWEVISSHLGFSHYDASKVMGLAAYGNPEVFRSKLQAALRVGKDDYKVSPEFLTANPNLYAKLESVFGPGRYLDEGEFSSAMPISRPRCRKRPIKRSWRWCAVSSARCHQTNCAWRAASRSIA